MIEQHIKPETETGYSLKVFVIKNKSYFKNKSFELTISTFSTRKIFCEMLTASNKIQVNSN